MLIDRKTKAEYVDVSSAFADFCRGRDCDKCPFNTIVPDTMRCNEYAEENQEQSSQLMGLEEKQEHFEFDEAAFKDLIGI